MSERMNEFTLYQGKMYGLESGMAHDLFPTCECISQDM